MAQINWLVLLFIAQIVIFSTFMISFFTMESHRQAEQHEMQLELHRLRRDNLAKERKLIQLATRAEERLGSMGMAGDYDVGAEEGEGDLDGSDGVAVAEISSTTSDARCARLVVEWWVYEACLGQHVRQYHEADDKGAFEEHMLGKSDGEGTPGPDLVYGRGDSCPSADTPRQVTVRLRCREGITKLSFIRVSEPSTCQYVAELEGPPALCPWSGVSPPVSAGVPAPVLAGAAVSASDLSLSGTAQVAEKRQAVVQALQWSWGAYEKYAWGFDELKPVTRRGADWVGLGLTIVDSLDVLWLAGLKDEFAKGVQWVKQSLSFDKTRMISFFETTIRCGHAHTPPQTRSHPTGRATTPPVHPRRCLRPTAYEPCRPPSSPVQNRHKTGGKPG
jgi:mannosyl-oligosaccharide alpha-1,2-mannosidase